MENSIIPLDIVREEIYNVQAIVVKTTISIRV